ncbi:amino acid permease [Mesomycoplasma hyopneumoniae]|uniref:amino acid permease n=1 Tax=Mesomycoplasma hyopneumoniae TaxID=2099 RepID=UPI003857CEF7
MEPALAKKSKSQKITFFGALLIVLGASIGAGIFFKSKSVLENSGYNLALAIGNWIIACFSIVAMAIALVEISSATKKSNLSIIIWNKVFNSQAFFQISKNFIIYLYLPFTYFVLPVYFMQIFQDAIAAFRLDSSGQWNMNSDWIIVLAVSILITIYFFIIGLNTKIAEFHNKLFLFAKFLPILVTIIVGFVFFFQGGSSRLSNNFDFLPIEKIKTEGASIASSLPGVGVLISMSGIFFSYEGFFTAAGLQSEMKEPKKTPIAILLGIAIATIIYLFIAVATSIVGDGSISSFIQIAKNELNWSGLTIKLILGTTFLLIGVSLLGIINVFTLWGPRALEELIMRDEFSLLKKWKNRINLNKPKVSIVFLCIFSVICLIIFTLIGVFAFDDQSYGNYGEKLNNLYSFADITGNWAALISFLLIAAAIYGCIRNRKTQKIAVQKQRYFLFFGYISVIFITIVLIFAIFAPIIDLILIFSYKPPIPEFSQILKTRITIVIVLFLFIFVPVLPVIWNWGQKKLKIFNKRQKNSL